MRKLIIILFLFLIKQNIFSQGNILVISLNIPQDISVCSEPKNILLELVNPTPFNLLDVSANISLPPGIKYIAGSVTGASELDISNLSNPKFQLNQINTNGKNSILINIEADCQLIAFFNSGNSLIISSRVDYTTNTGITTFDEKHNTLNDLNQAFLSITDFTNQSYLGFIGETYNRCITITNNGLGNLSTFSIIHKHGSGIQVDSTSLGVHTNIDTTDTILLSGSDFALIGNGNNLFETGESVNICETIKILNCKFVLSDYKISWGCGGNVCENIETSANINFSNTVPNIEITPTNTLSSCLGATSPNQQSLKIINNGNGPAYNVKIDVLIAYYSNYLSSQMSYIDESSFTIQYFSLPETPIIADCTHVNTYPFSCITPGDKDKATISIPLIEVGDTVTLRWNIYNCCSKGFDSRNVHRIAGWRFEGEYENICGNAYIIPNTLGRNISLLNANLVNNTATVTVEDGQTIKPNFMFVTFDNTYSVAASQRWKFVVDIPSCFSYAGNFKITRSNGIHFWNPTSVTQVGDQITATFVSPPTWKMVQAVITFDLLANCILPGCNQFDDSIVMRSYYIPNNACACEVEVSEQKAQINTNCNIPAEGFKGNKFSVKRTSYGLPDNDNNGQPDPSPAIIDLNKIELGRAMFGDTIETKINGLIKTSITNNQWNYFYLRCDIINGVYLNFIDGKIKLYQNSTGNYFNLPLNSPDTISHDSIMNFYYTINIQEYINNGFLPTGFALNDADSIEIIANLKVEKYFGNAMLDCVFNNIAYTSNILNPNNSNDWYYTNILNGRLSLIGFSFHNSAANIYYPSVCDSVTIKQIYYLSIGPRSNNYDGGNLFKNEFRNWAHIHTMRVIKPNGFNFSSARFNQSRGTGTSTSTTSAWYSILPVNPNSDTLDFFVENFFVDYGGTLAMPDDGFKGNIEVNLLPTCMIGVDTLFPVNFIWYFDPNKFLSSVDTFYTAWGFNQDYITYEKPKIALQARLPNILGYENIIDWSVSIANTTNKDLPNAWFNIQNSGGYQIIKVINLFDTTEIIPNNDFYLIDTLKAFSEKLVKIIAKIKSCNGDSLLISSGWNCIETMPTNLDSILCPITFISLKAKSLIPFIEPDISSIPIYLDLCEQGPIEIEGKNILTGYAYNLKLKAQLPEGLEIVNGTTKLIYPYNLPYKIISDPVEITANNYEWDVFLDDSLLQRNGLCGVLKPDSNSFRIKFDIMAKCNFISGAQIQFQFLPKSGCDSIVARGFFNSPPIYINGFSLPYNTKVKLNTNYLTPCSQSSILNIVVVNQGLINFNSFDTLTIELPKNVHYTSGSFSGLHNPPSNSEPIITIKNNKEILQWNLLGGIEPNDSCVFSIDIFGISDSLTCGVKTIVATTYTHESFSCSTTGTNCEVKAKTGNDSLDVYVYTSFLDIINGSFNAIPTSIEQNKLELNIEIKNNGATIDSLYPLIIELINDVDLNNSISFVDSVIIIDTIYINIEAGNTILFNKIYENFNKEICNLIILINDSKNHCVCNSVVFANNINFHNVGKDTTICAGTNINIGMNPQENLLYTWNTSIGISDSLISNPIFYSDINQTVIDTISYILTTTRQLCISTDTIHIIVKPKPYAPIVNSNIEYCTHTLIEPLIALGNNIQWYQNVLLDTAIFLGNNYFPNINNTAPNTYNFYVTQTIENCESDPATVSINIKETPEKPVISGKSSYCINDSIEPITAIGTNIIWYSDSLLTSILENDIIYKPSIDSSVPGTYTYWATQTIDNCTSQAGEFIMNIHPLPAAPDITPQYNYCVGDSIKEITSISDLHWYTDSLYNDLIFVGDTFFTGISNNTPSSYDYFVSILQGNCQSLLSKLTINVNAVPPPPLVDSLMIYCTGDSILPIIALGNNVLWYNNQSLSDTVNVGNIFTTGISNAVSSLNTYWITQKENNCTSSSSYSTIEVKNAPNLPILNNNVFYCLGDSILPLTAIGDSIIWFSDSMLTNVILINDTLFLDLNSNNLLDTIFYLTQNSLWCSSEIAKVRISITDVPEKPFNDTILSYCVNELINLSAFSATNIYWYKDSLLSNNIGSGTVYSPNVSSSDPIDTAFWLNLHQGSCSSIPSKIIIRVLDILNAPIIVDSINLCVGDTVKMITAGGNNIAWSSDRDFNNVIAYGNTINLNLTSNDYLDSTLWLAQFNENCIGYKDSVTIIFNSLGQKPINDSIINYCKNESILPLVIPGNNIIWYSDSTYTNILHNGNSFYPHIDSSQIATHYYWVEDKPNYCHGKLSKISININSIPNNPVLSDTLIQHCRGNIIPLITITGNNIQWFADSSLTTNLGSGNIFNSGLIDTHIDTIYFWFTQTYDACSSYPSKLVFLNHSKPPIPLSKDSIKYCVGEAFDTIHANGLNINWYATEDYNNWIGSGNYLLPSFNNHIDTTYNIYITQSNEFCESNYLNIKLVVLPLPDPLEILSNAPICETETLNFTTNTTINNNYTWVLPDNTVKFEKSFSILNAQQSNSGIYGLFTFDGNCTSLISQKQITVNIKPEAPSLTSNTPVCQGEILNISVVSPINNNYTWTGPDGYVSIGESLIRNNTSLNMDGVYYCYAVQNNCESDTSEIDIAISQLPKPYLGSDFKFCPEDKQIQLNAGAFSSYLWSTGETSETINPNKGGTYWVMVTGKTGCAATDTIVLTEVCPTNIFIPNAFTPNGDGLNDVLEVSATGLLSYNIKVFNRWGELLFESSDLSINWDGTYKGKLVESGSYVYLVSYIGISEVLGQEVQILKGNITVLR